MLSRLIFIIPICFMIGFFVVNFVASQLTSLRRNDVGNGDHGKYKHEDDQESAFQDNPDHLFNWYDVLGVSKEASISDIQQAYRFKMSQYHPDKVSQMGPEIRAVAEKKSKEVNLAYQRALKDARGN